MGTVRLRYPRVADQHWRLQNDRIRDGLIWACTMPLPGILTRLLF